jgi:hypoxanthine phosphoribosyltransferase
MELLFFSFSEVWHRILETIPKLRQYGIGLVTYVPRGGCFPASVIAQTLNVPLACTELVTEFDSRVCLLVDDIVVTRRSLAKFKHRYLQELDTVVTYAFAEVPHLREVDCRLDVVSFVIDQQHYLMLPWEIGDMLESSFPFNPIFELDGIFRATQATGHSLLSTPYQIQHLVSFETDPVCDRKWLQANGYRFDHLVSLSGDDQISNLVSYMKEHHLDIYVGAEATRCVALKQFYPECRVISFKEMIEL